MADIDFTPYGKSVLIEIAPNPKQGYIDIIIGNDDVFLRLEHARQLRDLLNEADLTGEEE